MRLRGGGRPHSWRRHTTGFPFRRDPPVASNSALASLDLENNRASANEAGPTGSVVLHSAGTHPASSVGSAATLDLDGAAQQATIGRGLRTFGEASSLDADERITGGHLAQRAFANSPHRHLSRHAPP